MGDQNAAVLRLSNLRSLAEAVTRPLDRYVNRRGTSISDVQAEEHMAQGMQMHCHLKRKAEGFLVNISEQNRGQKCKKKKKMAANQILSRSAVSRLP